MQRYHYTDYQVNTIVNVFHFGQPDQMKVIGHDHDRRLVKLQYMVPEFGIDFKDVETLNRMSEQCHQYEQRKSKSKV